MCSSYSIRTITVAWGVGALEAVEVTALDFTSEDDPYVACDAVALAACDEAMGVSCETVLLVPRDDTLDAL